MKLLAAAVGLMLATVGVIGVAAPAALLDFMRSLQTQNALYVVTAVRVGFGAVLLWAAPASRMPKTLRVVGVLMIVAGLVGLFFGVERIKAVADWLSAEGPWLMRAWACLPVILGVFIVYAVTSSTRPGQERN